MTKLISFSILIFLSLNAFGQENSKKKTENHINIPGTRIFMIPPEGFKIADNFLGFKRDETSVIFFYDLDLGNFYSNGRNFNKKRFEDNGLLVLGYDEPFIDGFPAKSCLIQPSSEVRSQQVIFGDSTFSVMIMASYLTKDPKLEKEIKEAIFSIIYDKELISDKLALAKFTLDTKDSKFKFSQASSNFYIYSIDGVKKQSLIDEPNIIITSLPSDSTFSAQTISDMLIGELEKNGLYKMEISSSISKKVNDNVAYEVIFTAKIKGKLKQFYQLVMIKENIALSFQASAPNEFELNLEEFKKLATTLNFK